MDGYLVLEDGRVFAGKSFGAPGESVGEVVFNTSMTGYQEILTDPSYQAQMVAMTHPHIGNYGINDEDIESNGMYVEGLIVKEACRYPSNFMSKKTLGEYLKEHNVIGIERVDTRALTRHIRFAGSMKAVLYAGEKKPDLKLMAGRAKTWAGTGNIDSVKMVTCKEKYEYTGTPGRPAQKEFRYHVVAYDYGIKFNILRVLNKLGCKVTVVPASTPASEVLSYKPDGVFLSNGPGDPAAVTYAIESIRDLLGKLPVFGICLGHQLITLALGGRTYKLKFGHHGANHPVKNQKTGAIEITAQNHCYCADMESLKHLGVELTHVNLNDNTCEGLADFSRQFYCVQYHPEASPGPHDSGYLFQQFIELMEQKKTGAKPKKN
jgi:carbamoyl-phosphate synthase small subunit